MHFEEKDGRPGGAAGGQAAMARGVAPAPEAQSWPRLGSARNSRLKTIAGYQVFCRVVHPCSPSASLRPGNRARKAAGPIVLTVVPCRLQPCSMTPASRASSRCRTTRTAERPSKTSNVPTSDLSSLPRSLRAPNRIGKLKEFALWHTLVWPNCAARFPVDCARSSLKTRARTRPVGRDRHPPGRREAETAQSACTAWLREGAKDSARPVPRLGTVRL